MTTVIVAIDADAAAAPTVRGGRVLASLYDAALDVVHVRRSPDEELDVGAALGGEGHVAVRYLDGDVSAALASAIEEEQVAAAAIGARTAPGGCRPAGHVALDVAARVDKPVAIVPPEARLAASDRPLRVLVPLDGSQDSTITVRAVVRRASAAGAEVVVLHVFTPDTVPSFLDRPEHELPVWAEEFLTRAQLEPTCHMRWRSGPPGAGIAEAAESERADGVVLGWHQTLDPGRASVVRDVLARAGVPVVLVPRAAAQRALDEWARLDPAPSKLS